MFFNISSYLSDPRPIFGGLTEDEFSAEDRPTAGNSQARLADGKIVAAAETERGAK
jgi:hypothetical protein